MISLEVGAASDRQPEGLGGNPNRSRAIGLAVIVLAAVMLVATVEAKPVQKRQSNASVAEIMASLAEQNAATSALVRDVYSEYLDLLVIDGYSDLEDALGNGGLVPLPADPLRFNIVPRVAGLHPIGEKDLGNQASYIAARPATIGCLLEIAARVTSGPVEITSLVRHSEYQDALRDTNINATTTVPMHTMGLAFDIALINTPLETVNDILDVLTKMRDAGDILFIGERHQLVFHVVPQPWRLGYFTDAYSRALASPPVVPGSHQIAYVPMRAPGVVRSASVSAEVIDVRPTDRDTAAWWAAIDPSRVDASVRSTLAAANETPRPQPPRSSTAKATVAGVSLLVGLITATWRIRASRR